MSEKKEGASLSPIPMLAKDAWELFKTTWISYVKLFVLIIGYVFLAVLIGILISLPVTFVAIGNPSQFFNHLTPFHIASLVLLGLWLLLFVLSLIAINIIFPIVSIFILQGKKTPIFDLIRQSKKLFWPYFLTVLLGGLLTLGGTSLLVIPGIVIGLLFGFMTYEVVIDGQSGTTALKRSYFMVKNYFWEVLGRLLILEIAIFIVTSILQKIASGDNLLGLVQFLFTVFASWFSRGYVYLLYKDVRSKTTFPQQISIQWIWIVSAVGWAITILLLVGLGFWVSQFPAHPNHVRQVQGNAV